MRITTIPLLASVLLLGCSQDTQPLSRPDCDTLQACEAHCPEDPPDQYADYTELECMGFLAAQQDKCLQAAQDNAVLVRTCADGSQVQVNCSACAGTGGGGGGGGGSSSDGASVCHSRGDLVCYYGGSCYACCPPSQPYMYPVLCSSSFQCNPSSQSAAGSCYASPSDYAQSCPASTASYVMCN